MIFISLNETVLFRVLYWALIGRKLYLVEISPIFAQSEGPLRWVAGKLQKWGRLGDICDLAPRLTRLWEDLYTEYFTDIFRKVEPWMGKQFDFSGAEKTLGDYAMPYKHAVCAYIGTRLKAALFIDYICRNHGAENTAIAGFDQDVIGIYRAYSGKEVDCGVLASRGRSPILSWFFFSLIVLYSAFHVIRHLSFGKPRQKSFALGADCICDHRDREIYRLFELEDVLLVFRNRRLLEKEGGNWSEYAQVLVAGGVFSPAQAAKAVFSIVRETLALRRFSASPGSGHYKTVLSLPFKRALYRALFTKYPCGHFWGRDDYNSEHIIRSQELRRIGGVPMGLNHGLPIAAIIAPHLRYIDYDFYYTFGTHLYDKYYRDTWAPEMRVRTSGSLGMTEERLKLLDKPKNRNILFFAKPGYEDQALAKALLKLSDAFPDRKIILCVKESFMRSGKGRNFMDRVGKRDNIVTSDQGTYDLMAQSAYSVSDPSSVAAEAVHFAMASFLLDIDKRESLIFRDFPEMCFDSADGIIERIRSIESGAWTYPREKLLPLINYAPRALADYVAADINPGANP